MGLSSKWEWSILSCESDFFSSVPDYDMNLALFSEHLLKAKFTGRSINFGEYKSCSPAEVFLKSRLSQLNLKITEHIFLGVGNSHPRHEKTW